jgi:S-adenosyl-L-methionine hydrolase (adenosine-forming)
MPLIALITDFGARDWFAAGLKAAILDITPDARIIDITHDIPAGDIHAAAFVLRESCLMFGAGTVFCTVVDPGVGSARAALVCAACGRFFTGPDNGVLSFALDLDKKPSVRRITETRYMRTPVSVTFHGRDIFAPAAAHLAAGAKLESLGPAAQSHVKLAWPHPSIFPAGITAHIVYIDRFGNAFTSITEEHLKGIDTQRAAVYIQRFPPIPIHGHYAECTEGDPLAVLNASGFLEIAISRGNAARKFGLDIGSVVELRTAKQ